jgi:ABC-2 type transport system ATP-binding protein
MSAVKIVELTKIFRSGLRQKRVVALDHLNMTIEAGQIVGYLGPNGAGKTTTFKLLLGLLRPTKGSAWLLGNDIQDIRSKEGVGFLPEQPYFYDYLTAREFLDFYGHLFRQSSATRQKRVAELLELVNLSDVADVQLRRFSRGMLQRIGVAQALINDPQLIFLDEPMSGVDPIGRKQMRDLFLRLKTEGKTVLYSTHILSDVEAISDQVAILSQGTLHGFGPLNEILTTHEQQVEMNIEGLDAEGVALMKALVTETLVERENHLLVRIADEQALRNAHQIIVQRNAKLVSLVPRSESLEDLFVKLVGGQS